METTRGVTGVAWTARADAAVAVDGEPCRTEYIRAEVLRDHITVFVPAP